jgi:UDP-glucose 4-epimerase
VDQVLKDEEVTIHGDGSQTRSMAYVDDVIEGTFLAIENENAIGEVINIGNDEEMSVVDSARLIHKIANTGNELKLKFIPMENVFGKYKDIMRRVPDLSKAKKILEYSPKITMDEAIRRTIEIRSQDLKKRASNY